MREDVFVRVTVLVVLRVGDVEAVCEGVPVAVCVPVCVLVAVCVALLEGGFEEVMDEVCGLEGVAPDEKVVVGVNVWLGVPVFDGVLDLEAVCEGVLVQEAVLEPVFVFV